MDFKSIVRFGRGYPWALAVVLAAAGLLLLIRPHLSPPSFMLLMVPLIATIARVSGVRVSAGAAVVAFVALDVLFVPPYYHLRVAQPSEWLALLVFLAVALLTGQQTAAMRERENAAVLRQRELELLNRLSFEIVSEQSPMLIAPFIVERLRAIARVERAAIYAAQDAAPVLLAAEGDSEVYETEFVAWVLHNNKAVGLPPVPTPLEDARPPAVSHADALPGVPGTGVYIPLQTATAVLGVLAARLPRDGDEALEGARLLVAVSNLAAAALQRQHLAEEAANSIALQEADRLKATLVSSVSHELKTPLAAATARVTGLLEEGPGDPVRTKDELHAVAGDLHRLDASIGDLLDISRLESDAWRPNLEPQDVGDVLGTVLVRLPAAQRWRVNFRLAEELPPVAADFSQLMRAFLNIVENALAYSPADSPVLVTAERRGEDVWVAVEDEGPGVPAVEKGRVFEKFYRGLSSGASPHGTGLGLPIAEEIVRTHRGRIWIEDVAPHGARFVVALPVQSHAADELATE